MLGCTGTCKALSMRFHSNCLKPQCCGVSSRVKLLLQSIRGAGAEAESTKLQMVSKQKEKPSTKYTGETQVWWAWLEQHWNSLEEQLCYECAKAGWLRDEGSYCFLWGFGKTYCTESDKLKNRWMSSPLKFTSRGMEINFHHSKAEWNRKRVWPTLRFCHSALPPLSWVTL